MSGFLLPDDTERLPANFIEHLPGRTDPRMLYKSEWRIVMDLAKKVIVVRRGRRCWTDRMWTDIDSTIAVLREETLLRSEETAEEILRGVRAVADGLDAAARARAAGRDGPDADGGALRADPVGDSALRR